MEFHVLPRFDLAVPSAVRRGSDQASSAFWRIREWGPDAWPAVLDTMRQAGSVSLAESRAVHKG
jgi:hypothetical protein